MRKLPVSKTISHMLSSTFNNLGFALKAQWPWFVVGALGLVAIGYLLGTDFPTEEQQLRAYLQANPAKAVQFLFSIIVGLLVFCLAFSSVAVNWHRYVLLDEVPQSIGEKLRLDSTVWRYFGNILLITLLILALMVPLVLVAIPLLAMVGALAGVVVFACVLLGILPIIYRLSIKLPAIALGRNDFRMGDAWSASRENWWQIVGVGLIFSIISWGIGLVLALLSSALQGGMGPVYGFGIDMIIQVAINWILTVMGITMLTSLYGFFVEKRDF